MPAYGRLLGVAALLAGLAAGCSGPSTPEEASNAEPARVEQLPGTDVDRVILTARALERVELRTAQVQGQGGGRHRPKTMPYGAVVYGPDGSTWTYTRVAPRAFVRLPVRVSHIEDGVAYLGSGPPPGTEVVTVGAAELYGIEYGVGEE